MLRYRAKIFTLSISSFVRFVKRCSVWQKLLSSLLLTHPQWAARLEPQLDPCLHLGVEESGED